MLFSGLMVDGPVVIELQPHTDDRGAFARTFCADEFMAAGLPAEYPQCNLSINDRAGTLRGMHFNMEPFGESKVVRCVRGAIHDVVVDLRSGSTTRFEHVGIELSADNRLALFVPAGFAHGFITLEDNTDVYYHMDRRYEPAAARGLRWSDPSLDIDWPVAPTTISETDAKYPDLDIDSFDLSTFGS